MSATDNDPFDLAGRTALITGGSRGLGRQMAMAFALRGADVVLASRKQESLDATATEIAAATGRSVVGIACHVGRWDDLDALAATVHDRYGAIDVLVNNAGMSPLYPSLVELSEELFDKVINVNVKGPFRLSALIGEQMVAAGRGSIINVSSIAAVIPSQHEVAYGIAKAGVHNLTTSLAKALAPAVRVNCIMPGMFRTDISKAWDMAAVEAMAADRVPLGRIGEPDEIIGAALYLASDASAYTTGSILRVDGGHTAAVGTG